MRLGFICLALAISAATFAAEVTLTVPSGPKAKYLILEKGGSGAQRTIVTKRTGPSGTSYSKRLYNCSEGTVKYLGSGDSLDGMRRSKPDSRLGLIVEGSIAYYVGLEVCR